MTLIIFFLILSTLVLIHEFGHFYAGKKAGVKVHEFGLGLPPKVWSKKIDETEYSINLLPIGGFVRMEGEDPQEKVTDQKRSFQNKSILARLSILLAGVFMNGVLGTLLFYFFFLFNNFISGPIIYISDYKFLGAKVSTVETVVSQLINKDLSDKLKPGDTIYNVSRSDGISLNSFSRSDLERGVDKQTKISTLASVKLKDFQNFVNESEGPISIYIYNIQTQQTKEVEVIPKYDDKMNRKLIGIYLGSTIYLDYSNGAYQKLLSGISHSYNVMGYSITTFAKLIYFSFVSRDVTVVSEGVSGPVGIFAVIKGVLESGSPNIFWVIVDLTALLSLSLAIMNLLPIPALDGGRAMFVLLEFITKRRLNPVVEGQVHRFGMIFLLLLLVLITFKDVLNLF